MSRLKTGWAESLPRQPWAADALPSSPLSSSSWPRRFPRGELARILMPQCASSRFLNPPRCALVRSISLDTGRFLHSRDIDCNYSWSNSNPMLLCHWYLHLDTHTHTRARAKKIQLSIAVQYIILNIYWLRYDISICS